MTSPLKFTYESTELNSEEAEALMSLANNKDELIIDLSTVIKVNARSATEMFSLAVKHKNPMLASLAARLAISSDVVDRSSKKATVNVFSHKTKPIQKVKVSTKSNLKDALERQIKGPVENIINELLQRNSRWAAGVVSILTFSPGKTVNVHWQMDTITIKELAIEQNIALRRERVAPESFAFKGFSFKGAYDVIPNDGPKVDRNESFFTSPTYNALREGLIFCKANDLVELTHGLSVGANQSDETRVGPPTAHLQRTFWQIRLSPKGEELIKQWGDSLDFLVNFWSSRLTY